MGRSVRVTAKAKLNLALAVVGKRDDGYHELRSVFVTLDLADEVRVAPHKRLEVRNTVPLDGEDLAAREVNAIARATGREPFAFISIRKRIPLAAGMGGGSSDAAATLHGLAQLWRVDADRMCRFSRPERAPLSFPVAANWSARSRLRAIPLTSSCYGRRCACRPRRCSARSR